MLQTISSSSGLMNPGDALWSCAGCGREFFGTVRRPSACPVCGVEGIEFAGVRAGWEPTRVLRTSRHAFADDEPDEEVLATTSG